MGKRGVVVKEGKVSLDKSLITQLNSLFDEDPKSVDMSISLERYNGIKELLIELKNVLNYFVSRNKMYSDFPNLSQGFDEIKEFSIKIEDCLKRNDNMGLSLQFSEKNNKIMYEKYMNLKNSEVVKLCVILYSDLKKIEQYLYKNEGNIEIITFLLDQSEERISYLLWSYLYLILNIYGIP